MKDYTKIVAIYPLTPLQEGMLFHNVLDNSSTAYFIQSVMRLRQEVKAETIRDTLQLLSYKYEILRTVFVVNKMSTPMQVVLRNRTIEVKEIDLSAEENMEESIQKIKEADMRRGFDLEKESLIRVTLIKTAKKEYRLIWSMHHIIIDGWSTGILYGEFASIYGQLASGISKQDIQETIEKEKSEIATYGEYVHLLSERNREDDLTYWKDLLCDYEEVAGIPPCGNPTKTDIAAETEEIVLEEGINQQFVQAGKAYGVTMSALVETAYGILLQKYNRSTDVVFGKVVSGRDAELTGIEKMVGLFINTIPVRVKSEKDTSLKDLLEQAMNQSLDSGEYDYLGLTEIQEHAGISREYIKTIYVFENYFVDGQKADSVKKEQFEFESGREETNYDMSLSAFYTDRLHLRLMYNPNLYEKEEARGILVKLQMILQQLAEEPEKKVSDVEIAPDAEKQQILTEFNDTYAEYPRDKTIVDLFEEQVAKTPENIAVVYEEERISYRELNRKANQLAEKLRQEGVGPDQFVAILAERSIEMIVGIYGILKAGGAYVPMDPAYPEDRIEYMLSDCKPKAVVTYKATVKTEIPVIDLTDASVFTGEGENLIHVNTPNDLSYVIYTSGTTGKPKGVMNQHTGTINRIIWMQNKYPLNENDVILQKTIYTFDVSVWEILWWSFVGAKVIMLQPGAEKDPMSICDVIEKYRVTSIHFVPSMLSAFLQWVEQKKSAKRLDSLRYVFASGEALQPNMLQDFNMHIRNQKETTRLINFYGPTEASIDVTYFDCEDNYDVVPIGKPISNTQVYIVSGLNLCGIGIPGELCIAGDGLARGYLNQPDLTAEKFIDNPFGSGKLYRSGDLARWLPDGNIEFLGRIDEQVKIRGFRIELGEIESVIRKIAYVKDAAVIARERNGEKAICAYIVSDREVAVRDIREAISRELPEYMLPSYLKQIERIPVTRNGKLDKRALPEIEAKSEREYVAPRNETEEEICKVFADVLGLEKIGIKDNFFEMGGDSIKAIRVVSKARIAGYQVTVKDIMNQKTVELIAKKTIAERKAAQSQEAVEGDILPTPIIKWFEELGFSKPEHFNQAMLVKTKHFDRSALHASLTAIVKHHDMLRAVYRNGQLTVGSVTSTTLYDFEEHEVLQITEEEINNDIFNVCNQVQSQINLTDGPLVKTVLFRVGSEEHLLICVHHLVIDGVSWRILLEDFATAYEQSAERQVVTLPEKTASFQAWSQLLTEYSESRELRKEKPYWQRVSDKISSGHVKPQRNRKKEEKQTAVKWDRAITSSLLHEAGKAYGTEVNDILISALAVSIQGVTGQTRLSVEMEGHGRERVHKEIAIDRTVGWFTSMYPVVVEVENDLGKTLIATKEMFRKVPNHGMGYGVLKYLAKEISGQEADVCFNYLGELSEGDKEPERQIQSSPYTTGMAIAKENQMPTSITFNGLVHKGEMEFNITYDAGKYEDEFIERLAQIYEQTLVAMVQHCCEQKETIKTASDYGLDWGVKNFEDVSARLGDTKSNVERIYPLTPLQEGMLFHNALDNSSTAYFIQSVMRLRQEVKAETIRDTLQLLSYKYETLRTAILYNEITSPLQVMFKNRTIELKEMDLSSEENMEESVQKIKEADMRRGFDLEKESLLRVTLIKTAKKDYRLIWSMHHIIIDGWSNGILYGEFAYIYGQLISGISKHDIQETIEKEKSEIATYGDYVDLLSERNREEDLTYWKDLLFDYDEVAGIAPCGNPTKTDITTETEEIVLEEGISQQFVQAIKAYGVTMSTLVETAYGILLQKYNRSTDVVFGKVVSGRDAELAGIEKMVGLFINTIPVRVKSEKDTKLKELLEQAMNQSLDSGKYDYLGLTEIQEHAGISREYIKTIYVFENYFVDEHSAESVKKEQVEFESAREETNYDMSLSAFYTDRLHLRLMYNPNLYEKEEARGILGKLQMILQQLAEEPEKKVSDVEIVAEVEKQQILQKFNDTYAEYPRDKTIVDLFEEQVAKTPENIAVVFEEERISYRELNRKANQLAEKLRQEGVGPDQFVAILAERSIEMIVGIYGILKAGGAYVPMDPAYPEDRIEYMLSDCKPKAVVTYKATVKTEIPVIDLADASVFTGEGENLIHVNTPNDLIYVIYTSGTTGKPKGVMIEHQGVSNLREYFIKNQKVTEQDRVLQFASFSFDAMTSETSMSLLSGATLYVVSSEVVKDTSLFEKYIEENKITIGILPPQYLSQIKLRSMRSIISAGSETNAQIVEENSPFAEYSNDYGPTEMTVCATHWQYTPGEEIPNRIPIGKPIVNTQVYIVSGLHLCGIGIPGELCIAGDGLARGYLNRPELTAEKFIDNPFGAGKLYRSGDLARWLPDGNIEFLGRIDEQVKIRGFRIELGEIESVIRKIAYVKDAAVIAREQKGEKALCAYIVSDQEVVARDIREAISRELPEYMLPSYLMQIDAIPVTRNGKLDKRALPEIEAKSEREYIAPRNETEEQICKVFADVLGLEKVGIQDNFFEMGGHSLRATRVINQIEKVTGVRLALKTIFSNSTPEGLSARVLEEAGTQYEPIPKAKENEYYPMSSTQKRTYLINQMEDGGTAYNMPQNYRMTGAVQVEKLQRALEGLMERHEILRTRFLMVDGEPVQKIERQMKADFTYEESDQPEAELMQDFLKPFDLEKGPLVRIKAVKRETDYLLLIDMHHIVSDGMSMGVFVQEYSGLYRGDTLTPITKQYKDYSEWMRTRDLRSQREYWVNEFSEEAPVLDLPYDFKRPQEQNFAGAMVGTPIRKEIREKIGELCQKTGATEYMVLLAGFMVLLHKYSRQEDVVVGSPISGRTHKDTEQMLGMFINTLGMRGRPIADKPFIEFLKEVKETALNAYEHQEYPFEELVEAVEVRRDMSRNPLFDVMFVLQNNEDISLELSDVKLEQTGVASTIAKFDLTLSMGATRDGYWAGLEYCTALFTEETAKGILSHFEELLEQITIHPNQTIGEVEIITKKERNCILKEFNDTYAEYPREKTIVDLFEEQVAKTPENIAVVFEEERISYRELNRKANQLAEKLRQQGVGPDQFVAILAERSIEMIVGIYGILKAGGAYVPMDPAYPEDRIEYMLSDCKPKAVVTYKATVKTEIPVIDLADDEVYTGASENPDRVNTPEDMVYCIYTSGTTGESKGVLIENRNLTAYVSQFVKCYGIDEKSVILQQTYVGFDTSIDEIYPVLISGGKMVAVDKEHLLNSEKMKETITNERINIISCTPLLIKEMDYLKDTEMKTLISGGEVLKKAYFERIKDTGIGVYNTYGPAEATVCVTYFKANYADDNDNIPIGKPIANTQIYILNALELCGIGIPGELCIAGDGLARGYLNRPELTAEKFIDNPFGAGKLYRSGDLARWLPDGNIEFLGRIDEQVKIRGFRIELGEIESVIRKIAYVKDAAVIAREQKGEKALCAYIVSDQEVVARDIREAISRELPEYMLPSYLMQIDAIPVTRNGKLDKRALPEIEAKSEREYIAPRNETEEQICKVFADVLGLEKVGIQDNFFEMGGHSLRATRVINQIEKVTGVRLALKTIFSNSTPEGLSARVLEEAGTQYEPIPKAKENEYYPMSSTQKRTYLINQMEDGGTAYNMPQNYRMTGDVQVEKLQRALEGLMERHEILRTRFLMVDGEPVQKIERQMKADFTYEESDQPEAELMQDFLKPFDLEKGPLVRIKAVKRETDYLLLIDMHHIVSDGMSMGVFVQEYSGLYRGDTLTPITKQYKDYSEWMRTRDLRSQREYWVNEFSEEAPVLDLPYDFKRPQEQSFAGAMVGTPIRKEIREKIGELCQKTGATEYMVLLAGFMVLLHKYSRQEDVVVGSPISGRTHKDTEQMLGMFINTLGMRGRPIADKPFIEFLKEVKETALNAYEHQEYPFEELVEAVEVRRDMSRNPLFDVMFVLQNNEDISLEMSDVKLEQTGVASTIAKFDLTLSMGATRDGYWAGLEYCTALFTEETAKGILSHFEELLEQITIYPNQTIGEVEIITKKEQNCILKEFNDTYAEYPRDKTIVDLFEEQVAKTPENIAVVFEEERISYRELNRKANQLAEKLRQQGVGPDTFVAILAERSIEMIVGIYGILKAGGAYVPMDPAYPEDRIEYMLSDCKPKAVVTYKATVNTEIPVMDLTDESVFTGEGENLIHVNTPTDLIYVIYTSGTTGKPKGVMIEHQGVSNLREYFIKNQKVTEQDRVLQFASFSFDAMTSETSMSLLSGATLYVVSSEVVKDTSLFEKYIEENKITIGILPPQYLSQIKLRSMRSIISAGSETNAQIVEENSPFAEYSNDYGPTEMTVCATHWQYTPGEEIPNRIPIGKPIVNTQVYIVSGLHLCGIGIPGELCIAGDGLARGYLNRPELTAEKFIDNPFGAGKLYRSGDLARWLPDGNIEFLGRIDEQVKIRGFRIELGEIESVIRKIAYVKDAAVIAREQKGEKALCAYIVSDQEVVARDIREAISRELPEYMLPSYLMQIDAIPVTRNGKLDKRALPEIEAKSEREYIAPRNETEEQICKVFADVLGLEKVGIQDNFFEMGGHSLRATRVINQIEKVTGVRLALKTIFSNSTPEGLSARVLEEAGTQYEPIPKAKENEYYPMSSTQKRTYLINQMEDGGTAYNMPQNYRMTGDVQVEKLQRALEGLMERHEILRTRFLMVDGEPVQKIERQMKADFTYEESDQPEAELMQDFLKPFDLEKGPLVRIKAVKRETDYLLLIDMHHIVSDGMSMGVFVQEYSGLYRGDTLTPITKQYKDYSEWMRTRDLRSQREYWVNEFSEEAPVLDLPYDFKRPQEQNFAGAMVGTPIRKEIREKIGELCQKTGATEYMVLLAGFMVLLHKYSRQEDVVVGSPISGRTHKDTEQMLGMFINTLGMRGRPIADKPFIEFLKEVKETALNAYEHQEYPFEELVEAVEVRRDMSRNPLFDVMFVLQNNEDISLEMSDVKLEQTGVASTIAKFDLTLSMGATRDGYWAGLEYCTALFTEETAKGILSHFEELLEQITIYPNQTIGEVEIITKKERNSILTEFNDTYAKYPRDKTIVDLFEEQVAKTPENIAVVYEEERISYRELNRKANQLAEKLRQQGVGPDTFVAILAERSIEMIVGIYGILKAGGAYVPMDPAYPEDRIEYMLSDCKPKAVVTYKATVKTEIPVIDLTDASVFTGEGENLIHVNTPNNLIYVIYTSGTTGKPKGVMIEHKSVIRLVRNTNYILLDERTVILQTGQLSFDASTFEVWGALLNGGQLILSDNEILSDAKRLKNQLNKSEVNTLWLTSTLYNQLITSDQTIFERLEHLLVGGEALSEHHVHILKNRKTNTCLINGYGPTENTTFTTTYEIPEKFIRIPIGKPIANTQIYILNALELCGIGIPGELCIAGDGLARGYLNRPELTAEKFIDNPFGAGKLYRSGDLARWLPDGNIEFLGRIDEQVKIRGFRIELGEIESVIRKIAYVKDAAVIAREQRGEKALCAYIVSDQEVVARDIREAISRELPEYMLPSYLMQIDAIPVTRNGKLDKRALPEIEAKSEREYIAPRNETEEQICKVFADVLGLEKVGIQDNFFEMGGHSLRATRVINQIEKVTGVRLALKTIFSNSTPEGLSARVLEEAGTQYEPIPKAKENEYYPMSSTQKRTYLINQMEDGGTAYNMPQNYRMTGAVQVEKLQRALEGLMERHEILRTRFLMVDGEPVQKIERQMKADFTYEESDQPEAELMQDFLKPFDLEKGPLVRIKAVKRETDYLLLIDMHHIVSDGMSMGVFVQEYSGLYRGDTLTPITKQYKDYSEWMRTRDLRSQREYWVNEFSEEAPVLDLPYDFKRPQEQSFAGAMVGTPIRKEIREKIGELCQKTGATEYMVLLAGFMVLLHKYSRQEDVVVGSPISGRTHKDTEQMLGMFINTLGMRGRPIADKPFIEFLKEVKETALNAYEHQEYPFEELVEAVEVRRDMSRNPLFDVMFVLQNNEDISLELSDVKLEQTGVASTIAKFDLTLSMGATRDGYWAGLGYCTALFTEETAKGILSHFEELLEQITIYPNQTIGEVEIITKKEQNCILKEFNDTYAEYPRDKTIVDLFEEQVAKTPENIAVVFEEERISYRELNRKANQLAEKLRQQGVGPDTFVAILAERSIEMIVGIYGILKAGGAYVPMDPAYPEDRIEYMLSDCKPKAVVTYKATVNTEIPVMDLTDESVFTGEGENLIHVNTPTDLIYVIYTSGTTGKPKGVMNQHAGIVNLLAWMQDNYPLTEEDAILQKTTYVFDVSASELFWWSTIGARVIILKSNDEKDPNAIIRTIEDNQISIIDFVPSMLSAFMTHLKTSNRNNKLINKIKYVIMAGEALNEELVNEFFKETQKVKLINLYGPTEASIYASYYNCETTLKKVPIGKPIANTQIYIVSGLQLCGIGIPGELCIAGDGLARGYLNRPELTAEKFIDNPFGAGKLYRSGDLARWLPDGNIEFLGRIDEQVKIRGFRIELGEIESVIRKIAYVKDVAVIAREQKGEKALCAYIVSDRDVVARDIREAISRELPEYMLPSYLKQIERIPVTRNGKLDKRALPEIEAKSEREYVAPRNETEEQICKVFADVLGLEKVGIKDNFFEMGGDSIKAIRAVSGLRLAGVDINVSDLMRNQRIENIKKKSIENMVPFVDSKEELLSTKNTKNSYKNIVVERIENISHKELNTENQGIICELLKYNNNLIDSKKIRTYPSLYTQRQYIDSEGGAQLMVTQIRVTGQIERKHLISVINRIVESQAVFRTVYCHQQESFIEVSSDEWYIPYFETNDINEFGGHLYNALISGNFFAGEDLLSNIAIEKTSNNVHNVYFYVHHCIFDKVSSDILFDIFKKCCLNPEEYAEPEETYADYVIRKKGEIVPIKLYASERKIMADIVRFNKLIIEQDLIQKGAFIRIHLNDDEILKLKKAPICWIMKHYADLANVEDVVEIPFQVLYHGREHDTYQTLGLYLDLLPASYNHKTGEVCGGEAMIQQYIDDHKNIEKVLERRADRSSMFYKFANASIENRYRTVYPWVNFIGFYKQNQETIGESIVIDKQPMPDINCFVCENYLTMRFPIFAQKDQSDEELYNQIKQHFNLSLDNGPQLLSINGII